jgi:hypothetical protein
MLCAVRLGNAVIIGAAKPPELARAIPPSPVKSRRGSIKARFTMAWPRFCTLD